MINNQLFFERAKLHEIQSYSKRINEEFSSGDIGYYHLPELGECIIDKAKHFMQSRTEHCKDIVLIGIGGSSLGVKAFYSMLAAQKNINFPKLHFLDNVDVFSFENIIKNMNFATTIFLVSSKSGNTIETITLLKIVLNYFKPSNLNNNFLFITEKNSNLEYFANCHNAQCIEIPPNVGGRFSVLSAIGIVPLTLCGFNTQRILHGALKCKKRYLDNRDDTILQKAYHYTTHQNITINTVFSYCDRMKDFNDWYVQLWAESLGKRRGYKRVGITPIGLIGSRDQHSFLQLIMDGPKDKSVTFIKILDHGLYRKIPNISLEGLSNCDFVNGLEMSQMLNYQCDATMRAVLNEGISVDVLTLDRLDEENAGFLVYYFELLTSAIGLMLGINTYNQPGVEVGKKILKTIIQKKS